MSKKKKRNVKVELELELDVIEKINRIARLAGVTFDDVVNVAVATYIINRTDDE